MEAIVTTLLSEVGIRINGSRPFDIQVHHPDFYQRVLTGGSMALGESYMDGWWDCDALDQFFYRLLRCLLYTSPSPRDHLAHLVCRLLLQKTFF